MDKYDYMILDIIQTYKQEQQAHIRLAVLERNFWKRIEADTDLSVGQARIGERITNLYLDGMLQRARVGQRDLQRSPGGHDAVDV